MAPRLDPEEDRVREELRDLCIIGSTPHVCELLNAVPLQQVKGPLDKSGGTALHLAARGGHLKLTQELIQRGFEVNCQDASQRPSTGDKADPQMWNAPYLSDVDLNRGGMSPGLRTPLHVASMEDHAEVVLELITGKADVNMVDESKQTALHKVVQCGSLEVLQVLVEHGQPDLAAADVRSSTPLLLAAELGKIQFVEYLLAKDPSLVSASNIDGWTALHLCAHGREMRRNSLKPGKFNTSAKLLLDAKANVDAFDEDRKTPLHRAAQTGERETVDVLLQNGANVGAEDCCRWTPLHYAAQDGHLNVARTLLQAKAQVQQRSPSCLTPLAVATMENQIKMAELLMSHGADHGLRGKGLASPIMIARKEPNKYAELLALFELGFISHE